jgi:hypothetical protein
MSESNNIVSSLREKEKNEAKMIILQGVNEKCRGIANDFFDCMEKKFSSELRSYSRSIDEVESISNEKFVPYCMKYHNLEMCLKNIK